MHKVGYRPAPSAFVLLLQEIVSQLLIGNDYANSSITKTYLLILFRSLSHPCAEGFDTDLTTFIVQIKLFLC